MLTSQHPEVRGDPSTLRYFDLPFHKQLYLGIDSNLVYILTVIPYSRAVVYLQLFKLFVCFKQRKFLKIQRTALQSTFVEEGTSFLQIHPL